MVEAYLKAFVGVGRQNSPVFVDWSIYSADKIRPELPPEIAYTPPKPQKKLRSFINPVEQKFKENEKGIVRQMLHFLEAGIIEDDFGKNYQARNDFFMKHKITIQGKTISLHEVSQTINKLSIDAISNVFSAGYLVDSEEIYNQTEHIRKKIAEILHERRYLLAADLEEVNALALAIIENLIGQYASI